jgi:hypothetical protein
VVFRSVARFVLQGSALGRLLGKSAVAPGDLDMVLHFRTEDTILRNIYAQLLVDDINADGVLDSSHQEAGISLTGRTVDEVLFEGVDELDLFLAGRSLRDLLDELASLGVFD